MFSYFKHNKDLFHFLLCLIIISFSEIFFFRNIIGNTLMIGDRGDGRLTMLLTEHWWNFFNSLEKFNEISMFFPDKEVFGHTDLLLGYGLLHSIFRLLGLNMFTSYKCTLILFHSLGTITTFILCHKILKMSKLPSLFATIGFSFSNTFSIHVGHTQLIAISFLPMLSIFIIKYFQNINDKFQRNKNAIFSLFFILLIIYNSWYIAYFTFLFLGVFFLVYIFSCKRYKVSVINKLIFLKKIWKEITVYIFLALILLTPFFLVYMPVLRRTSGFSFRETSFYLPELIDIINVGESNFLLGKFIASLNLSARNLSGEQIMGFSIILLGLFLFFLFVYKNKKQDKNEISLIINSFMLTIVISILMVLKLSSNGVSFWQLIYKVLPGSSSVRAISRLFFFLSFPMSILVAFHIDKLLKMKILKRITVIFFLVLLWISNININGVSAAWDLNEEQRFLEKIIAPPKNVKSFYIVPSLLSPNEASYLLQLDAFEIANKFHIKTINGYSGHNPIGWDLTNINDVDFYNSKVKEWINKYSLDGVFAYDRVSNQWIDYSQITKEKKWYRIGDKISFSKNGKGGTYVQSGFSSPEELHTWTIGKEVALEFYIPEKINTNLILKFKGWPFLGKDLKNQQISVYANSHLLEKMSIDRVGEFKTTIKRDFINGDLLHLTFIISNPENPKNLGLSLDNRELGFAFQEIIITKEKE